MIFDFKLFFFIMLALPPPCVGLAGACTLARIHCIAASNCYIGDGLQVKKVTGNPIVVGVTDVFDFQ
jgi:hypothetical protein